MVSNDDLMKYKSFLYQITLIGNSYTKKQVEYYINSLKQKVPKEDWAYVKKTIVNPWKTKLIIRGRK